MAGWPTVPEWPDPTSINSGNQFTSQDSLRYTDMNKIVTALQYLKISLGSKVDTTTETLIL